VFLAASGAACRAGRQVLGLNLGAKLIPKIGAQLTTLGGALAFSLAVFLSSFQARKISSDYIPFHRIPYIRSQCISFQCCLASFQGAPLDVVPPSRARCRVCASRHTTARTRGRRAARDVTFLLRELAYASRVACARAAGVLYVRRRGSRRSCFATRCSSASRSAPRTRGQL
jgi:hypothetical protein